MTARRASMSDRRRAHRARQPARRSGRSLFRVDANAIARANRIDEAITIATLPSDAPVRAGEIVATVKIIPFAVRGGAVDAAADALAGNTLSLHPWIPRRAALVLTRFDETAESILERAAAAQRARLARLGGSIARELRVGHDVASVAEALTACADLDPILVMGASAIVDRRDVVPTALERAGGHVVRLRHAGRPGKLVATSRSALGERAR